VNPLEGLSESELAALDDMNHFREEETGYQAIQGTKPQTLGYGLTDSPAGLAGWIVEKFRTWSDCGGDVESSFTKDQLLTNITAYWVTNTIASSVRLYCESQRSRRFGPAADYIDVPTGAAIFPKELYRPPRAWAEAAFNIVHWTEMPRGGHFAAMEEPDLLVDDVRSFFRLVR
jgi:microsomal epoxide hydrolase